MARVYYSEYGQCYIVANEQGSILNEKGEPDVHYDYLAKKSREHTRLLERNLKRVAQCSQILTRLVEEKII